MSDPSGAGARPPANPITDWFWAAVNEHRLDILRCDDCGYYIHPPRPVCRICLSTNLRPSTVSGSGRLYSFTLSTRDPHPWLGPGPYLLASVELAEQPGLRMVSNIVGAIAAQVRIDVALDVAFLDVAPGLTLPVWEPTGAVQ